MTEATPAPWKIERKHKATLVTGQIDVPGAGVRTRVVIGTGRSLQDAADMSRVVACVNLCAGVSTRVLELLAEHGSGWLAEVIADLETIGFDE